MKQQLTGVEYIKEKLMCDEYWYENMTFDEIFEQAKEMEKSQRQEDFINGYKARAKLSGLIFDEASELTAKELFKQQEQ
jgi:hypothetical protein